MVRVPLARRTLLLAALVLSGSWSLPAAPARAQTQTTADARWVIEADEARSLLASGALLLDSRGPDLKEARPLPGSVPVIWQDFTNPDLPNKGLLLADDAALTEKLRALGVSADVPVIAVGDSAAGWGEDGRIVWTLRTLGHGRSFLVNGGIDALLAEGDLEVAPVATPGDFTVARDETYDITKEELAGLIDKPDVVILDTREPREYAGETPYGESRGGHVRGAKHVFFKDLVASDGKILKGDALKARLTDLGVSDKTEVVSYCTGGIRSGFVTAVLQDAGVKARNYAGSMWEWSASDPAAYPLVTE